jgi:carnitine-CoA ligase
MRDYPLERRTIGHVLADKAEQNGSACWLMFSERSFTYADLHSLTNRYADGFRRIGVAKGDHVALMLPNCPEFFFAMWGLAKLGAVVVPLNTAAKGDLLRYFIVQSDTSWLVISDEFTERVAENLKPSTGIKGCFVLGKAGDSLGEHGIALFNLQDLEGGEDRIPDINATRYNDPHLIMYTSGTTGPSKGVISPHSQAHAVGRHLVQQYGYRSDDVLYTCLPLFHGNALWYTCFPALWADAALAVSPRFSATQFWDDIRGFGATQFNALGAMINILLKAPPSSADRDHRVRLSMVVPLSRETYRELTTRFGLRVTSLYAMTETFPVTMFTPEDPDGKGSSAGKPRGLADIQIVDEEDRRLAVHEIGEICVRPREPWIMMLGYYKMPEATVRDSRNLWFHTGDRGYIDKDGYLYFVDRKKEAIRRRGENIAAYEVEMLTAKHPDILEVAAVPVASELGEDEVMIYVVPKPGRRPTEEEIVRFCNANMAYFMVPRFIAFIDTLPKTASEKIEKYKLRSWAEAHLDEIWDREKVGLKLQR